VEDWAEIRRLHRAERMPIRAIARAGGGSEHGAAGVRIPDGQAHLSHHGIQATVCAALRRRPGSEPGLPVRSSTPFMIDKYNSSTTEAEQGWQTTRTVGRFAQLRRPARAHRQRSTG
jgi:hypothetical protein